MLVARNYLIMEVVKRLGEESADPTCADGAPNHGQIYISFPDTTLFVCSTIEHVLELDMPPKDLWRHLPFG